MKSDFLLAITQLSAEKNLPKEVVIGAVEAALVSAYRKDSFTPNQKIAVKINTSTGKVEVWAEKTVVETLSDSRREILLDEARRIKQDVQIGEEVVVEATPRGAGRIAAQTAKQVILQRLHEAEHSAIFEEYAGREDDIVTGVVQRIESGQIIIDLGRTEAVLPVSEQVRNERYRIGQRLKVYLLEVARASKGPRVIVSRSHPNLLHRLFELEIPEVFNGIVEIKSIAREAGFRSKVAVAARQDGIDPVGCCVGLRGIRIQNVVGELNGEKLDVVMWSPDASVFIASALNPAQVLNVKLDEEERIATVVVPDRQLSLAIGREGQNVRLAAKLTGWRIDIKSTSVAEAEKVEADQPLTEVEVEVDKSLADVEEWAVESLAEVETGTAVGEELPVDVPSVPDLASVSAEAVGETAEPPQPLDAAIISREISLEPEVMADKAQIRFAEDVMVTGPAKPVAKSKKKKKKSTRGRERGEEAVNPRKARRGSELIGDEEEY